MKQGAAQLAKNEAKRIAKSGLKEFNMYANKKLAGGSINPFAAFVKKEWRTNGRELQQIKDAGGIGAATRAIAQKYHSRR